VSYTIVIPARYASTRLPAKPLADIAGKPMIQHVWERACESSADRVIVATDHLEVFEVCQGFGADVCMTREDHESGTDRLAEVVAQAGLADDAIVVNVQGDEPLIPANVIEQVASNLASNPDAGIATLCERIEDNATLTDSNAVKVVFNSMGYALYFSRSLIPFPRDKDAATIDLAADSWYRHLGIYAYRAGTLKAFTQWPMADLERLEKLEQLRALYQGTRIHVEPACTAVPGGVDTPADLLAVNRLLGA
jgi:3-deoxy-manno-octulosonate cytidylyltransferase (CMP-KDO synthetase)